MIKISIIIPAYNEEKYIAKTLLSLKKQTYKDYEIIVINNNSTDNTEKIAKKYVKNVYLETNKGYHNAVNRGVNESKGDIIAFCDADSIYPKDWIENIMSEFGKNPEIIAVYGSLRFYDFNFLVDFMSSYVFSMFLKISKLLGFDNTAGFNFAMKKEAYLAVGGYNPKIYNSILTDIELGKRLQKIGKLKQKTKIKVYTSSRRFKEDGLFKTIGYFLDAWYRLNFGKKQKISYEEYNKEYRDNKKKEADAIRWLNTIKIKLIKIRKSSKSAKNKEKIQIKIDSAIKYIEKQKNLIKKRIRKK